ncbi:hypothetical protein X975_11460, partial [Stegodyphus mimosarum]
MFNHMHFLPFPAKYIQQQYYVHNELFKKYILLGSWMNVRNTMLIKK